MTLSTRDKLVRAASVLFRQKGYHGTGIGEILEKSGVPKGSLYHHFPGGKPDLAVQTAEWAGRVIEKLIEESFQSTDSFEDGLIRLCNQIADFFESNASWDSCPVTSILLDGGERAEFRILAKDIFENWKTTVVAIAEGYGIPTQAANTEAEKLLMLLEGAWTMSRAEGNSDKIRAIPRYFGSLK
ncbi:MAG: TetR/AcrR family transcriptional regulator [Marinosulfonomonas sp.]|nr:TetR/AcrR family transcriptional regulator [Marinosulfonomonas sp.]